MNLVKIHRLHRSSPLFAARCLLKRAYRPARLTLRVALSRNQASSSSARRTTGINYRRDNWPLVYSAATSPISSSPFLSAPLLASSLFSIAFFVRIYLRNYSTQPLLASTSLPVFVLSRCVQRSLSLSPLEPVPLSRLFSPLPSSPLSFLPSLCGFPSPLEPALISSSTDVCLHAPFFFFLFFFSTSLLPALLSAPLCTSLSRSPRALFSSLISAQITGSLMWP